MVNEYAQYKNYGNVLGLMKDFQDFYFENLQNSR